MTLRRDVPPVFPAPIGTGDMETAGDLHAAHAQFHEFLRRITVFLAFQLI